MLRPSGGVRAAPVLAPSQDIVTASHVLAHL